MMTDTSTGISVDYRLVDSYFKNLVNNLFKILPMRENNEQSLGVYIHSLQTELLGFQSFVIILRENSGFLTILSILQYLKDNPECDISHVRREVFHTISICNKLRNQISEEV